VLRKEFQEITFTNFGNSSTETYGRWSEELRKVIDQEEYSWITLNQGLLRSEVSFTLLKYDVFVHAFNGSLDKILIEAAMSGIPIVTTNLGFVRMFGSWGVYNGKKITIEDEYRALVEFPRADIEERLLSIRNLAVKMHSETVWVQKLVEAIY
jgi:glycosyltransferase involved in cell wall biosynthesis